MEETTIQSLIPEKPTLHWTKTTSSVAEALDLMSEHQILSLPVFDESKGRFIGIFDVHDALSFFLGLRTNPNASAEFAKTTVASVYNRSGIDVFMPTPGTRSLLNLIEIFTRGVYRIPVSEGDDDTGGILEGIGGGSTKNITTLISQTAVVRFLADNLDKLTPGQAAMTLDEMHLGHKKIITITGTQPVSDALSTLDKSKIGALAVVDDHGVLIEAFATENLRGITADALHLLDKTVAVFLSERPIAKRHQLYICRHDSTLKEVITALAASGAHRLWIVDSHQKPEGVISTSDVMKGILIALRKEHKSS